MSGNLDRLRKGQRWWAAELLLRAGGLILLGSCYRVANLAISVIDARPSHPTTPGEFALCALAFALLTAGLALTIEGPGLFRLVPIPARSAFLPRN